MNPNHQCPICSQDLVEKTGMVPRGYEYSPRHLLKCLNGCYLIEATTDAFHSGDQPNEVEFVEQLQVVDISVKFLWMYNETLEEKALRESLRKSSVDVMKKLYFLKKLSS